MPKKRRDNKRAALTPKGQRAERRRRRRLILISAVSVVIVAAVSLFGWTYYNSQVKPYQQAAIRVNNVTFDMQYFINMLKIYYGNISPTSLSDYSKYGEQEVERLAAYVEQLIIQNETLRQGSLALGVQIERDEIEAQLKEADIPVTDEQIDLLMAQRLVEKQVPSPQPQFHVLAVLLESESAAQDARARLQAGESFESVANDVSKIDIARIVNGDLGWVTAREADLTVGSTNFGDIFLGVDAGVLSGPVYDDSVTKQFGFWVAKVVEKTEATDTTPARIHVLGILVGSEPEAYDVIDQLNAGADMNELAKQVSQLSGAEDNGAELGWLEEGQASGDLATLFDLPLNEVSTPLGDSQTETKGGYWVFNVLEKDDNRELTTGQKNGLVNDLLERCSAELEKDPNYDVESLLTPEMVVTALNEVVLAQGKGSVLIRTASLPAAEAGVYYSQPLETYGNQQGNTWSVIEGNLPQGLSLDGAEGVISGTPELAGGSSLTLRVDSGYHYWTQELFLRIHFPLSVTTDSLPDGQVGVRYSATLEIFGDSPSYTWSIISGRLPDGLDLNETTGTISGMPTTPGTYDFTVQVDDGWAKVAQTLSLNVTAEASPDD